MMTLTGLSEGRFQEAYRRDRTELDRGTLGSDEYWRGIFSVGGITATPEMLARIEHEDALGWSRVNQRVVDWSYELRESGFRTAILSNMPVDKLEFMHADGKFGWINDFAVAVFSCEHLLVKPEPAIYRLCLEKLGASPGECLFLDDVPENVQGARAVGVPAIVFRSVDEAAVELARDWGLPVRRLRDGGQK